MDDVPAIPNAIRQSPIWLRPGFTAQEEPDYLVIEWAQKVTAEYHGTLAGKHGKKFLVAPGYGGIRLDGVPYLLREIHAHTPAEHLLVGKGDLDAVQHQGEIHLVHQALDSGRYAVLGVFLRAPGSSGCEAASSLAKAAAQTDGHHKADFDPRELLPKADSFFRYQGSLTTGTFAESVSWVVFDTPLNVTETEFALFGSGIEDDPRAVQDRNRRIVIRCPIASMSNPKPSTPRKAE